METLFLLRHGETVWNEEMRVMGSREIPLNSKGILQAKRIATLLPKLEIDAIYTSPLRRALETAHILAKENHVPIKIVPDLTEVAFGRWEGLVFAELIRDKTYRRFIKAPLKTAVPGGETIRDVQRRGLRAIRRAVNEFPGGRLLFVSHGDVIRAMICHYMQLPLQEFRRLRIDTGSLTVLEVDGGWAEIKFLNYLRDGFSLGNKSSVGLKPARLRKRKLPLSADQA